jgi:hypothetical protein
VNAANGATARGVALQRAREEGDALALCGQLREHLALNGGRWGAFDARQRTAEAILLQARIERRDGLLPHERSGGVEQHERAEHDQHP